MSNGKGLGPVDILKVLANILLIGICLSISAALLIIFVSSLNGMNNHDWTMFIALLALAVSIIALTR